MPDQRCKAVGGAEPRSTGAPHIPHSLFPIPAFRFTSIVGKKLVAMRIEQFQRAAAAAGAAGQRALGDLHVQAGILAQQAVHVARSEERRGGKECVSTVQSRWAAYPEKKTKPHTE